MDIKTVFGIVWRQASWYEVSIVLGFFAIIIILYLLVKYNHIQVEKRLQDYQLLLFKMKKRGLSNFQIKIINNIIKILRLNNPVELINNPEFFEHAIGKFLNYIRKSGEQEESNAEMFKEIALIYENFYHRTTFKKPLNSLKEMELNKLLYFTSGGSAYLGKIISHTEKTFEIQLFRNAKNLRHLTKDITVKVFLWRLGDAEYFFESKITGIENNIVKIEIPEAFTRGKEFRHPYVEVLIEANLKEIKQVKAEEGTVAGAEENPPIPCTIFKLNDYEAVARLNQKLDYNLQYLLEFAFDDFKFTINTHILSNRTVEDKEIYYNTIKFEEMSEVAGRILKNYISERL